MASKKKSGYDILKEKYAKLEVMTNTYNAARIAAAKERDAMYEHMGWFRRWLWDMKYNNKK